jgi:hypothetical protein
MSSVSHKYPCFGPWSATEAEGSDCLARVSPDYGLASLAGESVVHRLAVAAIPPVRARGGPGVELGRHLWRVEQVEHDEAVEHSFEAPLALAEIVGPGVRPRAAAGRCSDRTPSRRSLPTTNTSRVSWPQ